MREVNEMNKKETGKAEKASAARIYLGPSFYEVIQTGTTFCGSLPPKVAALMVLYPFLRELMVPVERLAEARKELHRKGSAMNLVYERARKLGGNDV